MYSLDIYLLCYPASAKTQMIQSGPCFSVDAPKASATDDLNILRFKVRLFLNCLACLFF